MNGILVVSLSPMVRLLPPSLWLQAVAFCFVTFLPVLRIRGTPNPTERCSLSSVCQAYEDLPGRFWARRPFSFSPCPVPRPRRFPPLFPFFSPFPFRPRSPLPFGRMLSVHRSFTDTKFVYLPLVRQVPVLICLVLALPPFFRLAPLCKDSLGPLNFSLFC